MGKLISLFRVDKQVAEQLRAMVWSMGLEHIQLTVLHVQFSMCTVKQAAHAVARP